VELSAQLREADAADVELRRALPTDRGRQRSGRVVPTTTWPAVIVLALALAAGAWAVVGSERIFTYLSDDHDEGLYLLQAAALADGHLFPPAPEHGDAFLPWLSVLSDGKYVLKYTPVHASILAIGVRLLGDARWSLGLIAFGVVVMSYALAKEVLGDRNLAVLATILLGLSPLFLLQSTTFLSYCSSLLLLEAFAFTLLRGVRARSGPFLVGSGFVFGLALFARPFDALLFGLPLGVYAVVATWKDRARLVRTVGWFALGAVLPVAAMLAYYRAATGSPFRSPFNFLEPQDTIGFGPRRLLPGHPTIPFTPELGYQGLTRHILLTSFWGFGGLLLVGFFVVGVLRRPLRRTEVFLGLVAVTYSCGYAFFWGTYGTSLRGSLSAFLGPFYFLPVLVPVTLLAAKGFRELWRRDRLVGVVAFASMLAVSGYLLVAAVSINLRLTEEDSRFYASLRATNLDRALVFVPPMWGPTLLHPFNWLQNAPEYDGKTVYALDRGESRNVALLEEYSGRTLYRMRVHGAYRTNPPDPGLGTSLEPLKVLELHSLDGALTMQNPTEDTHVYVSVAVNGKKHVSVLDQASQSGKSYETGVRITRDSVELSAPVERRFTEEVEADDSIWISISTGSGDDTSLRTLYERQVGALFQGVKIKVLLPGVVSVNTLGMEPWSVRPARAPAPAF
jgi:hypothetical protein